MPRKWTREERRKYLREKYVPWKHKVFTIAVCLLAIFITLALSLSGALLLPSLQVISAVLILLIVTIFFMVAYGGEAFRIPVAILAAILVILILVAAVILAGMLSGVAGFLISIALGLLFLVLIAFAAFFIDMETWESG